MPRVYHKKIGGSIISLWHITESEDALLSLLKSEDKDLVMSYKTPQRRLQAGAWRTLVSEFSSSKVVYDNNGAPYFESDGQSLSVSHTADYAAIVVSEKASCGVDIEHKDRDVSKVLNRYLSEQEKEFGTTDDFFLIAWCAKEAAFKYAKKSGVDFLRDIQIISLDKREQTIGILLFAAEKLSLKYEFFDDLVLVYII